MQHNSLPTVSEMLAWIQQDRPLAYPNAGFLQQLQSFFAASAKRVPLDASARPSFYLAGRFAAREGIHRKSLLLQSLGFRVTHDWTQFEVQPPRSDGEDARLDLTGAISADFVVVLFDCANTRFAGASPNWAPLSPPGRPVNSWGSTGRPYSTKRILAVSIEGENSGERFLASPGGGACGNVGSGGGADRGGVKRAERRKMNGVFMM